MLNPVSSEESKPQGDHTPHGNQTRFTSYNYIVQTRNDHGIQF